MPLYNREDMPQVNTQNLSKALSIAKSKVKVTKGISLAASLKPSQKQFIKSKIRHISKKYDKAIDMKPLIISKDNYIVDGHHRWAAAIYKFGNDVQIPTFTLHLKKDKAIEVYKMIALSLDEKSESEKADYVKGYEPVGEAMSLAARKKLARKGKSKLKKGLKKRIRNMKKKRSNSALQKAAIRQAKTILMKKMMKKAPSELSMQQKMKFSEKLAKKPGKIQKIAKKIFPKLKRAEAERVKKMRAKNTQKKFESIKEDMWSTLIENYGSKNLQTQKITINFEIDDKKISETITLAMSPDSSGLFKVGKNIEKYNGLSAKEAESYNETPDDAYVYGMVNTMNDGKDIYFWTNGMRLAGAAKKVGTMSAILEQLSHEGLHLGRSLIAKHIVGDGYPTEEWPSIGEQDNDKIDEETLATVVGVTVEQITKPFIEMAKEYIPMLKGINLNEDITIPIKVGDTVLGGKFKNKRIVVKSIGKNEKGDITINNKPLMKYRLLPELKEVNEFFYIDFKKYVYKNRKQINQKIKGLSYRKKVEFLELLWKKQIGKGFGKDADGRDIHYKLKQDKVIKEESIGKTITCGNCAWEWEVAEGGSDLYMCHKCGHDNEPQETHNDTSKTAGLPIIKRDGNGRPSNSGQYSKVI